LSNVTAHATGRLIVIDGIDQSGKKTQTRMLAKRIRQAGFQSATWDFPAYYTPIGQYLRAYLTGKRRPDVHVVHLLYAANKWEVEHKIVAQIMSGRIVVANRYTPSNLAYGLAHGLPLDWLCSLESRLPKPSRVFILDVPVRISFDRKSQHRDLHEGNSEYLHKVRKAYLRLSKRYRWTIIDGTRSPEVVHSELWNAVGSSLRNRKSV
jgi:dTMP kinase